VSPGRARDLVKGIIVDLDNALASNGKEALDERHSALASAMMLGVRLVGGIAVNSARIATALEKIEAKMEDRNERPKD
jgi:predicted HAD superfamily phosphohydrolase YqeG